MCEAFTHRQGAPQPLTRGLAYEIKENKKTKFGFQIAFIFFPPQFIFLLLLFV